MERYFLANKNGFDLLNQTLFNDKKKNYGFGDIFIDWLKIL